MKSLFLLIFLVAFLAQSALAKVLPQAGKGSKIGTKISSGIIVYPKLRTDRKALIVSFANLQNSSAVSYLLTYQTLVQQEGAKGTLKMDGSKNTSVELLFGTCSKNVCKYHTGISNARLEVAYTSTSGKKSIKKFKIKV